MWKCPIGNMLAWSSGGFIFSGALSMYQLSCIVSAEWHGCACYKSAVCQQLTIRLIMPMLSHEQHSVALLLCGIICCVLLPVSLRYKCAAK